MSSELLSPHERVLSTLNADGSRRWINPRVAPGRFLSARRVVAYALMGVFCTLPFVRIGGKPAVLLDITRRQFTIAGKTFLPTDTLVLALGVVSVFITVFLVTALLGRVWCGWACPQTVYMEFLFRPLERLLEGAPGRPAPAWKPARKFLRHALTLALCFFLGNVFLSYFVGMENLVRWVFNSPHEHLVGFGVVMFVTALMMFDFSFFREQTCIVACPYGRLQSVMLDRDSLIVSYDPARGEPRGKIRPGRSDVPLPVLDAGGVRARGDCVDCGLCVAVCPTGIDIRAGLQMECIGCAQCIDACDAVMSKLRRPTGLIRYSSQNALSAPLRARRVRPRVVIYPLILITALGALVWRVAGAPLVDASFVRGKGLVFNTLADGSIANQLTLKIANRTDSPAAYTLAPAPLDAGQELRLMLDENPLRLDPGQVRSVPIVLSVPSSAFRAGRLDAQVTITDGAGRVTPLSVHLLGPLGATPHVTHPENHP